MNVKKILTALTVFALLFVFSCADPAATRSVNTAVPAQGTQIFRGASMDAVTAVSEEETGNTVVMQGAVSDFMVGSHIILDDTEQTPGGRLYKVLAVADNGDGSVTLTVENGLLENALQDANFNFSTNLSNADIESVEGRAIDAKAITFSGAFDIDLGNVNMVDKIAEWAGTSDTDAAQIASQIVKFNIGGKLTLSPNINIDLKIEQFKTTYAIFDIGAKLDTNLIVDAGINYNQTFTIPLFKLNYGIITIMAGPVPIILQPQFDVSLHINPRLNASVKMVVSQTTELRVCAEKDGVDADWDTSQSTAKFSVPEFDGLYPKLSAGLGITLEESAGLCLYGALGVSVTLREFADFNAEIMDGSQSMLNTNTVDGGIAFNEVADVDLVSFDDLYTGDYVFKTGVSANVNIRVSAFGFINVDTSVWGDSWVMAQWNLNKETGYEKNPETGMYGEWTFPAIQHLIK